MKNPKDVIEEKLLKILEKNNIVEIERLEKLIKMNDCNKLYYENRKQQIEYIEHYKQWLIKYRGEL